MNLFTTFWPRITFEAARDEAGIQANLWKMTLDKLRTPRLCFSFTSPIDVKLIHVSLYQH